MEQHGSETSAPPSYGAPPAHSSLEIPAMDLTSPAPPPEQIQPVGHTEKTQTASPDHQSVPREAPNVAATLEVRPLEKLQKFSALIDCPFCKSRCMTIVEEHSSRATGVASCLCCIFCGGLGAIIPYVFKWSQDYHHICMNCNKKVAIVPNDDGPVQVFKPGPPQVPYGYPQPPAKPTYHIKTPSP